jgi:WD40 repeat protein
VFAQEFRTAAGFGTQPLPAIDEDLRVSVEASFPQPIAEAVAAFKGARNAHQGRDALREIVTTTCRYITLIALAAQAQVKLADAGTAVSEMLRELHKRTLTDEEWLTLARELVRPFTEKPRAHPLPELVMFLSPTGASEVLATLVQHRAPAADALDAVRSMLPEITRLLRALTFLADYALVVVGDDRAESWMGLRRPRRVAIELHARNVEPGQPVLVDASSRPVVSLWPLVQISSPLIGAAPELFMLDGRGRRGARLVALPQALERQDDRVWDWLTEKFAERDLDRPVSSGSNETRPYRGLAAFTSQDAEAFVGREREIDAAVNRLRIAAFVAVVGPSGAGKSSFVHAGVIPSLPEGWTSISVRPSATPIAALELRLRRAGLVVTGLAEAIDRDPAALGEIFQARETPTVLVIDQFEELFTLGASTAQQALYVRALLAAAQSPDDKLRIVLTLRDDFLARAAQLPELRERLPSALFLLGTPAREELSRILVEPLKRAGFDFDDAALPARMVNDVADTPGALALLSFTAQKLWELRDRHFRQLTRRSYEALGGVAGALAQHAEATLASMSANEQRLARVALGHLVTAEGTRAVLSRSELDQLLDDPNATAVIEKLIAARLLTATEAEGGDDVIELVHETLVVNWPRLAEWRREDAEGVRLRDQVRAAARQWTERGKPGGLLWRDEALVELQVWRARHPQPMTDVDEAFVSASLADAARGRRLRRGVIVGIGAILAIAITILIWANQRTAAARSRAEQLAFAAEKNLTGQYFQQGRKALIDGDAPRAMAFLNEAFQRGLDTPGLRYMLAAGADSLRGQRLKLAHDDKVQTCEWSPDGTKIISASADKTARLWDANTGAQLAVMKATGPMFNAHLDRTGRRVVTASADGKVRVYDLNGNLQLELAGPGGPLVDARFSPDGTLIAAASYRDPVIWDAVTGKLGVELVGGIVNTVAFSPDGSRLAAGGDHANLFDPRTGALVKVLEGHTEFVMNAAFSNDGAYLITTSVDQTARLWDGRTGASLAVLRGDGGYIKGATFDPMGRSVVTISSGNVARAWRVPSGESMFTLDGHTAGVASVAFDPTGKYIASGSSDGRVIVADATSGAPVASLQGHNGPISALQFSPNGLEIVTGSYDGTVRVWKPVFAPLQRMLEHPKDVNDARFSPDGTLISTACSDHLVRIYNTETGSLVRTLAGHTGDVTLVRFDAHGGRIVSGGDDHKVIVWDVGTGSIVATANAESELVSVAVANNGTIAFGDSSGHAWLWRLPAAPQQLLAAKRVRGLVRAVAFSPDDQLLATGGYDRILTLWRVRDGSAAREPFDIGARIWDLAFSPDGTRLAVAHDGAASVLTVAKLEIEHVLRHGGFVESVRFRPDGKQLVTASEDSTAALWDAETGVRQAELRGHSNIVFTATYDPSGQFVVTGGDDRIASLWDATTGDLIQQYRGHSIAVSVTQFAPDGKRLLTVGYDRRVGIWEFALDHRSRAEMARFLRCSVGWKVNLGVLESRPTDCAAM